MYVNCWQLTVVRPFSTCFDMCIIIIKQCPHDTLSLQKMSTDNIANEILSMKKIKYEKGSVPRTYCQVLRDNISLGILPLTKLISYIKKTYISSFVMSNILGVQ